jgi:predicted Ser/Thr protein kinase
MKRTLNNKNDLYIEYFIDNYKKKIDLELEIIINSCIKGIDVKEKINDISNDIFEIIDKFELANQLDDKYNCNLIPLNYGSTSNIFLLENKNIVLKVYNDSLRWKCTGHENSVGILTNEIQILNKIKKYNNFQNILYTNNKNKIYFTYLGETLFDNFNLPENWKNQITDIFEILDKENIYYPEFNIKNIICSNSQLYLIDFGLAKISEQNNKTNLFNHIELLSVLDEKFKTINDKEKQYVFYNNFISNLKSKKLYSENIF